MLRKKRFRFVKFKALRVSGLGLLLWTFVLALLYSFPWLRIPDLGGVALPLQRLVSWGGLVSLVFWICLRRHLPASRPVRVYLGSCIAILVIVALGVAINISRFDSFNLVSAVSEYSKYIAVFAAAYIVYSTLKSNPAAFKRVMDLVVFSGVASILISYLFLVLYWAGFRTENEVFARTFGQALGVWPTSGFFPRLAGTGAEPQQLSVLFLTPLLIMAGRSYIRTHWPIVLLGIIALGLSQSKFALVSLLIIVMYFDLIYKRHRLSLISLMLILSPAAAFVLARLPTFSASLEQGLEGGAFVERFDNFQILIGIISSYPLIGIGVGQYGTYRGQLLYGDFDFDTAYRANNDLLSIFAETGVFGFAVTTLLFLYLFMRFLKRVPPTGRIREIYLAFFLGCIAIFLNMFIGYAFLHVFFWINLGVLLYLEHVHRRPA